MSVAPNAMVLAFPERRAATYGWSSRRSLVPETSICWREGDAEALFNQVFRSRLIAIGCHVQTPIALLYSTDEQRRWRGASASLLLDTLFRPGPESLVLRSCRSRLTPHAPSSFAASAHRRALFRNAADCRGPGRLAGTRFEHRSSGVKSSQRSCAASVRLAVC